MFLPAMSSLATTVTIGNGDVGALLIIAGPMSRLTHEKMKELLPALLSTAAELSEASSVSPVMRRASI
jgi:DNA-binding IclR family transcriptional regulator